MEDKFKNRYRLKSARKPHWDYSWRGRYFVTICTRGRAGYFGKINDGQMLLSKIGEIVKSEWLKSPEIRSDMNLELDIRDNARSYSWDNSDRGKMNITNTMMKILQITNAVETPCMASLYNRYKCRIIAKR